MPQENISYRLKLGADLLQTTGLSVTEIAYQVGFSNASYFAEAFRKTYRCTPVEYRNSKAPKG